MGGANCPERGRPRALTQAENRASEAAIVVAIIEDGDAPESGSGSCDAVVLCLLFSVFLFFFLFSFQTSGPLGARKWCGGEVGRELGSRHGPRAQGDVGGYFSWGAVEKAGRSKQEGYRSRFRPPPAAQNPVRDEVD